MCGLLNHDGLHITTICPPPFAKDNSKALAYQPSYSVIREPLQSRVMRNMYFMAEKVQGIAAKGKKVTREMKEYFR